MELPRTFYRFLNRILTVCDLNVGTIIVLAFVNFSLVGLSVGPIHKLLDRPEGISSFNLSGIFKNYNKGGKGSSRSLKIESVSGKHTIQFWSIYSGDVKGKQLKRHLGKIVFVKYVKGPSELFRDLYHPYSITTESKETIIDIEKEKLIQKVWDITYFDYLIILLMLGIVIFSITSFLVFITRLRQGDQRWR